MLVWISDSGQTRKKAPSPYHSYFSHLNLLIKDIISSYKTKNIQNILVVLQCQHPTLDSESLAELMP